MRATARSRGDARPGHHPDLHRVELFLRIHGAARPHLRPRGGGLLLRALRQPDQRGAGRTDVPRSKAATARWPAPPAWRRCTWPSLTALADRRKSIVAANALYGATVGLLMNVLEPSGVAVRFADVCDLDALRAAVAEAQPGLHPDGDHFQSAAARGRDRPDRRNRARRRARRWWWTTPSPRRCSCGRSNWARTSACTASPSTWPATATCWAAWWSPMPAHFDSLRALSRTLGPVLGPFESYLTMRGIKTFPLRMERQCANACRVAHLAGRAPARGARLFHRRPARIPTPPPSAACFRRTSTAPW